MTARALIVGNTDGIGRALTKVLLDRDWSVSGVSRRTSDLAHPHYRHAVADVAGADYARVLDEILAEGRPDLCVYCVGIGELFEDADFAPELDTFRVNLMALAETAARVVPAMRERPPATFAGLSSMADAMPSRLAPAYSASKAGMSSYLEGLGLAVRDDNVRVVNVRLGFVDTKMAKSPVKPFMLSPERAAVRIADAVTAERPPLRVSIPRRMALTIALASAVNRIRPGTV